jgi:hypothetical protein
MAMIEAQERTVVLHERTGEARPQTLVASLSAIEDHERTVVAEPRTLEAQSRTEKPHGQTVERDGRTDELRGRTGKPRGRAPLLRCPALEPFPATPPRRSLAP